MNASDPRQAAKAEARAKHRAYTLREGMRYIINDERGRHALYDLMDWCGLLSAIPAGRSDTEAKMGRREVALEIRRRLDAVSPAAFWSVLQEGQNKAGEEVAMAKAASSGDEDD